MSRVTIVGILNTTPDSYFDGGRFVTPQTAADRAEEMIAQGADIIEVGGESTGPNAPDVSADEELSRTINVIKEIRRRSPSIRISIDTYKSSVASAAIAEGASMVNDVTAGRRDPGLFSVVKKMNTKIVLMFAKDATPRTTIAKTEYDDVIGTVKKFLTERKQAALDAGIDSSTIILDPGLGHFVSSDAKYSLEIIERLSELSDLGSPLFLSPSRKSFLAGQENLKVADRLPGTIAASAIAVLHGAEYIRTHDVGEIRRACDIAASIRDAR